MVKALAGTNTFALKRRLDELVDEFVSEHGSLALERIDAEESELKDIMDAIQSMPFLSAKKLVVVRSLGANKQAAEAIEQIISAAGESTELIIYEPHPDKRTRFFKVLAKQTELEQFNDLDGRALASWLTGEAKKQGAELSASDANYLVERLGSDQYMLFNELNKLITYNPKVTRQTIELLTEAAPQSRVFELLDAAFGGNKKRALRLYEEQRAQKVEPQAVMAMITWQLYLLSTVKYSGNRQAGEVAQDLGMNPYPLSKAARLAESLSENKLKSLVDEAFELDWKSKTSAVDLDEALKTYIVTI